MIFSLFIVNVNLYPLHACIQIQKQEYQIQLNYLIKSAVLGIVWRSPYYPCSKDVNFLEMEDIMEGVMTPALPPVAPRTLGPESETVSRPGPVQPGPGNRGYTGQTQRGTLHFYIILFL